MEEKLNDTIEKNEEKANIKEIEENKIEEKDPLKEIKEKDKEVKELKDKYLRSLAELENFKKRTEKELKEFKSYANEAVFFDMLTIVDNLERAIDTADNDSNEEIKGSLIEGVKLTLKEILKIFEKHGVNRIKALEETFNPAFHNAVMKEETEDYPENKVIKELQKGYIFKERLLRPSMVVVSVKK